MKKTSAKISKKHDIVYATKILFAMVLESPNGN